MPPTGVVDAFKNLIRHGKHHNHVQPPRQNEQPRQHQPQGHNGPAPAQASKRHNEQPTAQAAQPHEKSPPPREAAEMIVNQERAEKSKMPTYKGLESYTLLEKMGDGAFSNVYKAVEHSTNRKVAVKVVRKYELNASQRANILKEVQIMRGIQHPSIVKLYSFSESPEHYFLVLELMEGGELFHQIVKLTYFSENLSRHVILQVAHGIRHLHEERGVVHRDIKPENLLFERIDIIPSKNPIKRPYDEEKEDEGEFIPGVGGGGIGRVKIADFGLSKVVWDEQTMTPCGTVGYTAPEIVKDERYSKSVDMWALGCVLYTLLCGFPPFYDESINVLTEKVARGYYTFLSPWWDDISESAKDLIKHLLCVDPAQRYTIDEFLAHPWCNAAPAPPPPPTPLVYSDKFSISAAGGRPIDSPLLSAPRGNWEGRSPGLATLKEAFDITYAVHRMEEEGARRRKYGRGTRGFLSELNEDDEMDDDEDDDITDENDVRRHPGQQQQQPRHPQGQAPQNTSLMEGRAGPRDQGNREWHHAQSQGVGRTSGPSASVARTGANRARGHKGRQFELDLDGATLLERRQRRAAAKKDYPGSPLRMEGLRVDDRPSVTAL
ncbi:CAMK/CAMK1 protein kinase [Coprinopsis cinerea AmutBmut pab1-1]|uniref:Ser/Thr protein kinase CoPK032 short n=1 Tax=Coprinopsis cinerea TaxID=5346 RepID=B5UA90_COPCI|nr:CAMK/CAMK1 protein kinase [Coprinopsis cinerea AmutBmut pab1-1]BAG74358.1 Ser/Thr protein kinase CoPK032 short [Coprinopsis cinerea]